MTYKVSIMKWVPALLAPLALPHPVYAQAALPSEAASLDSILSTLPLILGVALVIGTIVAFKERRDKRAANPALKALTQPGLSPFERGLLTAVAGALLGGIVGYLTRPYTEADTFLNVARAGQAVQAVGTHMLLSICAGLIVGVVLHFLISSRKEV